MTTGFIQWIEILFDLVYLTIIWIVVLLMFNRRKNIHSENQTISKLFQWTFFLLALGDTGHVGFRVLAYIRGGLAENPLLLGVGKLATAITVSIFYMLLVEIWRSRFHKSRGVLWWGLMGLGFFRLFILLPSGNQWFSSNAPHAWSLIRNLPLFLLGIGIAITMLVDAIKTKDKLFQWISIMIFVSYLFYTPVILFVNQIPMLGMLMMPKTVAYVVMAFLALKLFPKKSE